MKKNRMTLEYSMVQAGFWMGLCIYLSFASVFLLGIGYTNTGLGTIIAGGSLLSALLSTFISDMIDRRDDINADTLMMPMLAAETAAIGMLAFRPSAGILTTVCFILYICIGMSINSLNLKLYIDADHQGAVIDYGISRAAGSLAYVIISFLLGVVITHTSIRAVPLTGLAICILQAAAYRVFRMRAPRGDHIAGAGTERGSALGDFARKNRRFCAMLAGAALLFYAHNTVCNYLINVVENVGGGPGEMGFLNGFMAMVEIPVMLLYSRYAAGRSTARIMIVSFVFFGLKGAAIAAARSFPALIAAFVTQAPSFALYTAAVVPYTDQTVPYADSAKAQSLVFSMTTVGSVLSGTLSGMLYDRIPVSNVLWIAAAAGAAGAVIAIWSCAGGREDKELCANTRADR